MIETSRRSFLRGLIAVPAVIAADRLMPLRGRRLLWRDETIFVNSNGTNWICDGWSPQTAFHSFDDAWRLTHDLDIGEHNLTINMAGHFELQNIDLAGKAALEVDGGNYADLSRSKICNPAPGRNLFNVRNNAVLNISESTIEGFDSQGKSLFNVDEDYVTLEFPKEHGAAIAFPRFKTAV